MRELTTKERAELSVGIRTQTPLPLPEFVYVVRNSRDEYAVLETASRCWCRGNESQVHNWLARHDYKRVQFAPGSWVLGTFKRPKEIAA